MIRHRPFGSGHAYQPSIDQRLPVRPLAGEPVNLGVAAAASVTAVRCEWDGGAFDLRREGAATGPTAGAEGHLATAAAGQRGRSVRWAADSPPLPAGRPVRYRFIATDGTRTRRTRWFDVQAVAWSPTGGTLTTHGTSRLEPGTTSWLVDPDQVHRVRFALRLAADEHVVGFGERFDRLDQRGHTLDATVFEQYKGQGSAGRTYLPMPFAHVLGGDGWAFYVDTAERTWYDVGDLLWIEADVTGGHLDVRFYDGDPGDVLAVWLGEVGRPEPMPDWVFRLWASGNEWNTQERVTTEMALHRTHDIPVGVVVVEAWSDESTFVAFRDAQYQVHDDGRPHRLADFTFPPDGAWPDPKSMVDDLHADGVKVVLWQIPLQKMRPHPTGQSAADAATMVARGYGVREGDGRPYRNRGWWFPTALMPDLTNPEARDWWLAKRRYLVEDVGVDGFKTDGGEHAWGHDLRYADGSVGATGNNRFPVHYAAAYGSVLRSCGKAPVTFSRAGFTGSQAHGLFWAGDEDSTWEAMRSSLRAGLTAAACGIVYWGWDLAGFSGPAPSAELYLRATAMSALLPIMQYHSEYNHHRTPSRDRTPWNIAAQTGDPRVLSVFRRYAHLRERLVPYLASSAARTIETGWPLLRSVCLVAPDDPRAWQHPYDYLLGDDLLVAPVVAEGATTRPAYLPPGRWLDLRTHQVLDGASEVEVPAPVDEIPVWCRLETAERHRGLFTSG
ncbi:TIM-barrel domain-containing protein [Dactylosporangium sp. NPDC049742]|uniref:glycoside hydrolase family 31 protein n=1 Tax=Dactylosporangium sp. NPDC049742 TaxID=3154737 RepID=UPI003421D0E9